MGLQRIRHNWATELNWTEPQRAVMLKLGEMTPHLVQISPQKPWQTPLLLNSIINSYLCLMIPETTLTRWFDWEALQSPACEARWLELETAGVDPASGQAVPPHPCLSQHTILSLWAHPRAREKCQQLTCVWWASLGWLPAPRENAPKTLLWPVLFKPFLLLCLDTCGFPGNSTHYRKIDACKILMVKIKQHYVKFGTSIRDHSKLWKQLPSLGEERVLQC